VLVDARGDAVNAQLLREAAALGFHELAVTE
jgi:hypothetical protein